MMPAATARWSALGTFVEVITTEGAALPEARRIVEDELAALDVAASRFRADSEVRRLEAGDGRPQRVSPLLVEVVDVALHAAAVTDGDLDPTIGTALADLGYDRDHRALAGRRAPLRVVRRIPGWRTVTIDRDNATISLPAGTLLDLGATAKAWAADRCAALVAAHVGCGVLVGLGGDIATAGDTPPGGWQITICDRPQTLDATATTISLPAGSALATSSTGSRTWQAQGGTLHHILDPHSLRPAPRRWRYVSVAARSCVDANTASTATIVRGADGPAFLARAGLAARLVAADGTVRRLGGWPADVPPVDAPAPRTADDVPVGSSA